LKYGDETLLNTACDNEALLKKEQYIQKIEIPNSHDQLHPDMDVIQLTIEQYKDIPNITHEHVHGHQDDNEDIENLSWLAQLNVEADNLATKALQQRTASSVPIPLGNFAYILLDNELLTSQYSSELRAQAGREQGLQYLRDKLNLSKDDYNSLHWTAYRLARRKLPFKLKAFVVKRLSNWIQTNERRHKCNEISSPRCPHCPAKTECFDHVLRCPALSNWRHRFLDGLLDTLRENNTPIDLSREIQQNIKDWFNGTLADSNVDLWMKGLIPQEWDDQVSNHLRNMNELTHSNNGRTWAKKLCKYIIMETYEAWKIRSSLVDTSKQTAAEQATRYNLQQTVTALYGLKDQCDIKYPFSRPLRQRLLLDNNHLTSWLVNHRANILRYHTIWKEKNERLQLQLTFTTPETIPLASEITPQQQQRGKLNQEHPNNTQAFTSPPESALHAKPN
jgi:hypothetical protein